MPQQGFVDQGIRLNPVGVTAIAAVHAAAIAALVLAKGPEIVPTIFGPTQVELIRVEPDPPPDPPQQQPRAEPQRQLTRIDTPPPVIPTPTRGPVIDTPPIPPQPWTDTPPGNDIVIDPPPQPQPPPPPQPAPPQVVEAARARGSLQGLFRPDDYPTAAAASGAEGSTGVRLTIGPDGRVANCSVSRSSGSRALDGATCSVLRSRARYTPARDQNNQPVSDTQGVTITWRLSD